MRRLFAAVLAAMLLTLTACGGNETPNETTGAATGESINIVPVEPDGVLTVGMECTNAPYSWLQTDDSDGAVDIIDYEDYYANGYDVMIAKKLCEENGWDLEIVPMDWDSLIPAVMTGAIDCAIAGQSMTAERAQQVDFTSPYLYASVVCLTTAESELVDAGGIGELKGTCTSQRGTIWYDSCLPQLGNVQIQEAAESVEGMLMSLEFGEVDFVCTDLPTARAAVGRNPNLHILDFTNVEDDFQVSAEEVSLGISVQKGNTELLDAINTVLESVTPEDSETMMEEAIAIQPIGE